MTSVWDFATKRKNATTKEIEGQCQRCNKIIKCSKGSIASLRTHLATHGIIIEKTADNSSISSQLSRSSEEDQSHKRQKTLDQFFAPKSLKDIITDLATDGITIRAITRNSYIRASISRDGFKLPANESDVMMLIHENFDEKKKLMAEGIMKKVNQGVKFSMTVDEVTTIRGRRYFGINLHERFESNCYKLGIFRIFGSCPAVDMVINIENHLQSFGISMKKDLVSSTLDAASINRKFIRLIDAIGQLCLNHGLHLGVCDTLYPKKSEVIVNEKIASDESNENDEFDENNDVEMMAEDLVYEMDYPELLKKVRKIVKFFKYSPVRNHVLQSKIQCEHGREIQLLLDVKTRWNSIPSMLRPLIKTEGAIRETLKEFNESHLIENVSFEAIKNLLETVEPVELAVVNLSREDSTLLSAETILNFMFDKLSKIDNDIAREMFENLKRRVDERMNTDVMNLLKCLTDPSNVPSRNTLNFAGNLSSRLFGTRDEDESESEISEPGNQETSGPLSLQDELNALLQKSETALSSFPKQENFKWLKSEFALFKNTGKRTKNMQNLLDALLTIKPTSTDVERVFSVCASFCTKIRSRLSDKSLAALVFLKYYYKK